MKTKIVCLNIDDIRLGKVSIAMLYLILPYLISFEDRNQPPLINKEDL